MEQKLVGIIIGITFIILGLMLSPAHAADGREPAMCSAVFVTAMDQYIARSVAGDESPQNTANIELYSVLVRIFNWARVRDNIHSGAYAEQVEFYMENMDTATALLHYDRCWHEGVALYREWRVSQSQ